MSGVICLSCDGWGCESCRLEREAARGGEQGLTASELEVDQLRAKAAKLNSENLALLAAFPEYGSTGNELKEERARAERAEAELAEYRIELEVVKAGAATSMGLLVKQSAELAVAQARAEALAGVVLDARVEVHQLQLARDAALAALAMMRADRGLA